MESEENCGECSTEGKKSNQKVGKEVSDMKIATEFSNSQSILYSRRPSKFTSTFTNIFESPVQKAKRPKYKTQRSVTIAKKASSNVTSVHKNELQTKDKHITTQIEYTSIDRCRLGDLQLVSEARLFLEVVEKMKGNFAHKFIDLVSKNTDPDHLQEHSSFPVIISEEDKKVKVFLGNKLDDGLDMSSPPSLDSSPFQKIENNEGK